MKLLAACTCLAFLAANAQPQEPREQEQGASGLLAALALTGEEREELLALALDRALRGDCEGALARLERAPAGGAVLARRIQVERTRLAAWIALRDAFLAELAASGKPLALELEGQKFSSTFTRAGDELVLARGPRLAVSALAPEALLPAIPKDRFAGPNEWLKIYPYCVAGNPKWKRLTTSGGDAAALKRDAEEFYPRLVALGPTVRALDRLSACVLPSERQGAQGILEEIRTLLEGGRETACVRARHAPLVALAAQLLALVADALELGELVHAHVTQTDDGTPRLAYDFSSAAELADWRRDDDYLASLRTPLEPVHDPPADPGHDPEGFRLHGAFAWRHVLEFQAPLCVRYRLRWEPGADRSARVFAFALGILADEAERHVRLSELGFLYVDEQDGRYTAVRPSAEASVEPGRSYALELAHDGRKAVAWVDGKALAEAEAGARRSGRIFLWGHSDLAISILALEIQGQVTPASLAALRAEWARVELERLGLASDR